MKIELENDNILFKNIKNGETFRFNNNDVLWMRLAYEYHDTDDFGETITYNVVALDDGTLSCFDDDERVTRIDTKIVNQ